MTEVKFFIVDAFTQTRYAGNPAGIVLTDEPLSEIQMSAFAGELHLETAFASPLADGAADFAVAYYTGTARVPLCGHDTIALASVLAQTGRLPAPGRITLATDVGRMAVSIDAQGRVTMDQALPVYGSRLDPEAAADALGLSVSEITDTHLPVQIVSTGTPFVIFPIVHAAALSALSPDMAALIAYGDSLDDYVAGFYVWSSETVNATSQIHARCFAPALGLPEDPVTGTASGALGAFLARQGRMRPDGAGVVQFRTEQGYAMGRPGTVEVQLEISGGEVTRVQVSGYAVITGEGTLQG